MYRQRRTEVEREENAAVKNLSRERRRAAGVAALDGPDVERRIRCGLNVEAFGAFVGGDFAVADVDDAVGVFGDVRLVRDDDDGVALGVQFVE